MVTIIKNYTYDGISLDIEYNYRNIMNFDIDFRMHIDGNFEGTRNDNLNND